MTAESATDDSSSGDATGAADIRIAREGSAGRIRLDRPRALHALDRAMCDAVNAALEDWRGAPEVEIVLIDHAAGRGFCAGGDIRRIAASGATDGVAARAFFLSEYRMNHRLFTYAKPTAAFMDGVTMGGGAGLALPCRWRVATENTLFAMPETAIGLFPDVGGGWYLSRLPGRMGVYLALTGHRVDGVTCLALGLATHLVPAARLEALKAALAARPRDAEALLAEAAADAPPGPTPLLDHMPAIDRLFAADRLEDILAALAADASDFAAETLATLVAKSPQACKVALRLLAESRKLGSFAQEMAMEYGVAAHVSMRPDFIEGVRALIVDKDNRPRWNPATPEDVTPHMIDTIFAPLPASQAWTPND